MMTYETIEVHYEEQVCFLKLCRPNENNTITDRMIQECRHVLAGCGETIQIIVLEGLPTVFCLGIDFFEIDLSMAEQGGYGLSPEKLYDLWLQLAKGPYVTIAHVRGKANAGGLGFVSACDIVLADQTAEFSLSELLFGLLPACVLPFLIRKVGYQRAHYMTLTTHSIRAQQAQQWGLVDSIDSDSEALLRRHLLRFRRISKEAIQQYKRYIFSLSDPLSPLKMTAADTNRAVFSNIDALRKISRYVQTGRLPWEDYGLRGERNDGARRYST